MVIVLDLMPVLLVYSQMVNEVKMLLFLELIIVLQAMLIIERKILVLAELITQGLDGTISTAETKCSVNVTKSEKKN